MVRTCKYFYRTRGKAFFSRLHVGRIERSLSMEYIKNNHMKPWSYTKEQVLGAPVSLSVDYQPKALRVVGTVMDTYKDQTHLNGGIKVSCKQEETNVMMWVPLSNPKVKVELGQSNGMTFEHFLDERDRWDEAYMSGKAR
eukprot:PhF_6_TR4317/c0_g1_i2/m.5822